jgi:chromosome segregation ATPase
MTMNETLVWCALIFALAYIGRNMLPSYYELTNVRRHSLDNMRDNILDLEESVNAINNAVDDNEQDLMGAIKQLEELQSDVAGHLTRLDDMKEAFEKMKELVDLHERRLDLHLERIDLSHDAAADTDHEISEIFKRLEVVERKTAGLAEEMP